MQTAGLLDDDTRRHYLAMARTAYQATQDVAAPNMAQMQSLGRAGTADGATMILPKSISRRSWTGHRPISRH